MLVSAIDGPEFSRFASPTSDRSSALFKITQPFSMDATKGHDSYLGHRAACDECSVRKIRCASDGGACRTCIARGATCTYSTKVPVGRPKKRRTASAATAEPHGRPAITQSQSYRSGTSVASSNSSSGSLKSSASSLYQPSLASSASSINESYIDRQPGDLQKSQNVQSRRPSDETFDGLQWSTPPTLSPSTGRRSDYHRPQTTLSSEKLAAALEFRLQPLSQTNHISTEPGSKSTNHYRQQTPSPIQLFRPPSAQSRSSQSAPSANILSFNALLGRVMGLRHKLQSVLNRSQHRRSSSDTSGVGRQPTSDFPPSEEMYTAISEFYDIVEPYLSLQQSLVGSMSSQKLYEVQTMLCLVVNAAATVVEMVAHFTERHGNDGMVDRCLSQHLSRMQTFSTLEFQIRRCERSLRITVEVLRIAQSRSAHGSGRTPTGSDVGGYCSNDIEPASVAALGRDALRLRTELSQRVELLKRPSLG